MNELRDYIKKKVELILMSFSFHKFFVNSDQSKTEERFYEYQENLKSLNKMIKCFQDPFYNCKVFLLKIIVHNECIEFY